MKRVLEGRRATSFPGFLDGARQAIEAQLQRDGTGR